MGLVMRRLDLAPWGSFTQRSLEFSGGPGVLELIDGPNAAGKSTIARAQIALLFGIPARTVDAHTHPYQDLAISAELLIGAETVELTRRKANVGSLRAADGSVLREDPIPAALGGLGRDIYESFFHVDHDTLVRGGEDLLQGKGEIGASLFAAAAGISAFQDHLAGFDARASDIFRPRAHTTALAQELTRLREREQQLKSVLVRPATHRRMEQELAALVAQGEQLLRDSTALAREIAELERRLEVAPLMGQHMALVARRAELGEVPTLAPDAPGRRAAAQATLISERDQRDRHRAELDRLSTQAGTLAPDASLIARAAEVRAVVALIPVVQKADADRERIAVELQQAEADAEVAARAVGTSAAALRDLARPEGARRTLDDVLSEGDRLRERRDAAQARHRVAADDLAGRQRRAPAADAPADLTGLEAGVRAARPRTGLEDQLAEARQRHARARLAAEQSLATLTPAPPTAETLMRLPALAEDTIAGLLAQAQQHHEDRVTLAADRQGLLEREAAQARLAEELDRRRGVVTPADVDDARARREASWQALRVRIGAGELIWSEVLEGHEVTVAAADASADGLARDAAGAELARTVSAEAGRLVAVEQQLDERRSALEKAESALAQAWAIVWAPMGLPLIQLGSVRDFQRGREAAQASARAAADAQSTVELLTEQVAGTQASLRGHLAGLVDDVSTTATLAELIALAEGQLERNAAAQVAAAQHDQALDAAARELAAAVRDLDAAEANSGRWLAAWPERRAAAGLPEHCAPDQAQEVLRNVNAGLTAQRRQAELVSRIGGIDRDSAELRASLGALFAAVATDLLGRDVWQAAAILTDRLAEQERREHARAELEQRRRDTERAAARADTAVADAQAELDGLCEAAGAASAEELPAIEARCDAAVALDRDLVELRRRILDRGADSFETLQARVTDLDPAETGEQITRLGERRHGLESERDALLEQTGQAKMALAAAEEDISAITAAEDLQFSEARIIELARQYAIARLSASVIRRAIERYRDRNQNPLVARANELFSRFTEGTYAELFVDVDDRGRGCLVARSNNRVIHTMDQMSKGTREQLFLALRIAAIERYVAASGPVPVLFDDVFVESDDARCQQIFSALGELSAQTQVIVLTHHHHLVAIASQALGSRLHVQELAAAKAGLRAAA